MGGPGSPCTPQTPTLGVRGASRDPQDCTERTPRAGRAPSTPPRHISRGGSGGKWGALNPPRHSHVLGGQVLPLQHPAAQRGGFGHPGQLQPSGWALGGRDGCPGRLSPRRAPRGCQHRPRPPPPLLTALLPLPSARLFLLPLPTCARAAGESPGGHTGEGEAAPCPPRGSHRGPAAREQSRPPAQRRGN